MIDFPDSPVADDVFEQWTYDGTTWNLAAAGATAADEIVVGGPQPTDPEVTLWYDNTPPPAPPKITSLLPAWLESSINADATITVGGEGFAADTTVMVGTVVPTAVTVVDPQTVTCVVNPFGWTPGWVMVVASNSNGVSNEYALTVNM